MGFGVVFASSSVEKTRTCCRSFYNLPSYQNMWEPISRNRLIATGLEYDPVQQTSLRDPRYAQLNTQQRHAYDTVVGAVWPLIHSTRIFTYRVRGWYR